jgi:hypothetical protein
MPNVKISGLTAKGSAMSTTDQAEINDSGVSKSVTGANIVSLIKADSVIVESDQNNTFSKSQRGSITALSDGSTITPNFADNNHFSVTLGGNRTLANPTNIVAGQSGSIFVTQDGTGSRTLSYSGYWDFPAATAPTLSTTAAAVDRIDYVVRTTTSIHAVATLNVS